MALVPSDKLNLAFNSNLETDQIVFTKDVVEAWPSGTSTTFYYDTGLNDFSLPTTQFSVDGITWYDQHMQDSVTTAQFGTPAVDDTGRIEIAQGAPPPGVTKLYMRIACFAHPNQKPFNRVSDGRTVSYTSNLRYKQIAASGILQPDSGGATEAAMTRVIPHNLGYVPNYRIFQRVLSSGVYKTRLMFAVSKYYIEIDTNNLYFDNTPLEFASGVQYFYYIYHD